MIQRSLTGGTRPLRPDTVWRMTDLVAKGEALSKKKPAAPASGTAIPRKTSRAAATGHSLGRQSQVRDVPGKSSHQAAAGGSIV